VDLPFLKYLKHYSAEQLFAINLASVTQFLETLSQSREQKLIERAFEQLERDQLQVTGQKSMTGEDITLMHYVRGRFLRKYIPYFTQDVTIALELTDEIEGFLAGWTTVSVNSYIQNITERKLPELELLEKTRALERSNQSLEQFAYAASHDLKEPLRKMKVFLELLKNGMLSRLTEEEMNLLRRIEKAGERMTLLVDDLLEYSHVSIHPKELEEVDLNEKMQRVLEDLELIIQEKGAVIHVEPLPRISGHRRQLQQLFQNLISNALKYSKDEEEPVIRITCREIKGEQIPVNLSEEEKGRNFYEIEVKDNGIGFEPEYAEKIFQVFQRLHGRSQYSGTGVGLAIVRKVVENHRGYIQAEGHPGKGANFKLYLPVPE
jgi:light-regulated signal transduction histidine kinase (bacteriophytochrome)